MARYCQKHEFFCKIIPILHILTIIKNIMAYSWTCFTQLCDYLVVTIHGNDHFQMPLHTDN